MFSNSRSTPYLQLPDFRSTPYLQSLSAQDKPDTSAPIPQSGFGGTAGKDIMTSQPQQSSSIFGKSASIFGTSNQQQQQPQQSSPFGGLGQQQQQPQQSNPFGGLGQQQQQPQQNNPFGGLGQQQQQPQQSSPFGALGQQQQQPQQSSPFGTLGQQQQQPQQISPFGNLGQQQQQPQQSSPFGTLGQQQQQPQQSSIFGTAFQQQQPQLGSLFGTLGQQQQQPQQSSIFGTSNQPQQPQQSNIFGNLGQQPQNPQQGSIFGTPSQQQQPPQQTSIFAHLNQPQQPSQQSNIFGASNQQQQPQAGPIVFPGLGGSTNQTQQQPQQTSLSGPLFQSVYQNGQQQGQQQGSGMQQSQTRLWQQTDPSPHPRPVTTQMEVAFSKWNPESSNTLFQTYLYNSVPPDQAPFYSPGPQDDEGKWEEALRKKPAPGAIPVLVKGFEQLGRRVIVQHSHLQILQGRLHEIDGGLRDLLKRHDLQISIRAAECKRRHLRLNHQCLLLAAKVQVLRNRGYSMDSAEEELREKMLRLEKSVFDPTLNGRGEEIWARMVSLRERGRQLQRELEKVGKSMGQGQVEEIDEEVMKRARKILEGYGSQLSHLTKELSQIQKDLKEWEQPATGGFGIGT